MENALATRKGQGYIAVWTVAAWVGPWALCAQTPSPHCHIVSLVTMY